MSLTHIPPRFGFLLLALVAFAVLAAACRSSDDDATEAGAAAEVAKAQSDRALATCTKAVENLATLLREFRRAGEARREHEVGLCTS